MLAPDCHFDHLDPRQWHNGMRLLLPPRALASPRVALAIVDGKPAQVVRAMIVGVDAATIDLAVHPLATIDTAALTAWASRVGVGAAIAIDRTLLPALSAAIEPRLRLGDDLVQQGMAAWQAVRPHLGRGLWTAPDVLALLPPPPPYDALQRTFDRLIPDDTCIAAYVFDDATPRLHASIIAHKRNGQLTRVTTHAALESMLSEATLAADWHQQRSQLVRALDARVARPSVLLLTNESTLRQVLVGNADVLSRELRAQRLLIDPAPTWLLGLLGGAAVAAVAGRGARVLASFLPAAARDQLGELAQRARAAAKDAGAHPFALLGFDPLALWAEIRHVYRA